MELDNNKGIKGKKFGKLTVIKFGGIDNKMGVLCNCICDCGLEKNIPLNSILSGNTKSCGCSRTEKTIKRNTTHGFSNTKNNDIKRIYKIWCGMNTRCNDKNNKHYKNYGFRGITVCKEWEDFNEFLNWSLKNKYSKNLSIERIDNDNCYMPNNCKWATKKEQNNNKRNNWIIEEQGINLKQYCELKNINYRTVITYISKNKSISHIIPFKIKKRG